MYSFNSIGNTNYQKRCEKKIRFIQQMLKYMDENDVNKKIDNRKALTHRNVGHIDYNKVYSKIRM